MNNANAPKPPEAPKVDHRPRNFKGCLDACRPFDHAPECTAPSEWKRAAPAPEPKQGSEEPITDHALECWHGIYTMSHNEAKWFNEACYARITALRAELAAADQNLKTMLQAAGEEAERQLAAEKARADRAEVRVKELEDTIVNGGIREMTEAARAHLALRAQLAAAQVEIKSLKFEKEAFREAHAEKARALAAAREEIAKLRKFVSEAMHEADAEKARADRAERLMWELVKVAEAFLPIVDSNSGKCACCKGIMGHYAGCLVPEASAILARAHKEGGSR